MQKFWRLTTTTTTKTANVFATHQKYLSVDFHYHNHQQRLQEKKQPQQQQQLKLAVSKNQIRSSCSTSINRQTRTAEMANNSEANLHQSNGHDSNTEQPRKSSSSAADMLRFLEVVGNLKHIKRTGWVLRGVSDCESVAGHMYRMSIMTFLLDEKSGLDRIKCMELALIHDLAESIVGDITPYCGISKEEKKQREMDAMKEIAQLIQPYGEKLLELFHEYEESATAESQFVKDLDRLDMVLQAFEYEKRDDCPQKHQEFFDSTDGKFNNSLVRELVDEIKAQREAIMDNSTKQASSS